MTSHHHLRVQTNLQELSHVLTWFEKLNQSFIPRDVWIKCQTALAEGFTNAVKHAHRNLSVETPIDIDVTITPQQLEIQIWDYGPAFDLIEKLGSQASAWDLDASSGRGLKLIQQLVDQFSYRQETGDRNCLVMIKQYSAP